MRIISTRRQNILVRLSAYSGSVGLVAVEVPDAAVVAVRDPVADHPAVATVIAATFRHDSGHQRRRPDVELQPLIGWQK